MTNLANAKALGRRFDYIARARWSVLALHVALGTLAFCSVNLALRAEMYDDWWWKPLRLLHLRRVPLFSAPWFVFCTCLSGPPLIYFTSWLKVKDSLLERTHGAAFWFAGGVYVLLFTTASIASDWLCLWAVKPPLCFFCLVGTFITTLAILRTLPKLIERLTVTFTEA